MLEDTIDPAAARTAFEAGPQVFQIGGMARGNHFHVAVLCVAHPATQLKLARLALHEPAEAHTLHTSLNLKMKDQIYLNARWQAPKRSGQPARED
jgi:hypothetical protein